MVLSIKDGDLTVSIDIIEDEHQRNQAELLLLGMLKAADCVFSSASIIDAYYHIDPDILGIREDDDVIWTLFQKYRLTIGQHIAEKE